MKNIFATCLAAILLAIPAAALSRGKTTKANVLEVSFNYQRQSGPGSNHAQDRNKQVEPDGFVWYYDKSTYSWTYSEAKDRDGNVIIPSSRKYQIITYNSNGFFYVSSKNSEKWTHGVCDLTGKELIPPSRGYSVVSLSLEKDCFHVRKEEKYGVCDLSGDEIISPDRGYDEVLKLKYNGGCYFVKKDGKQGYCDNTGKEVISPDRGYDEVYFEWTYYGVRRNGKKGACDLTGKEIVAPIYDYVAFSSGKFQYKDDSGTLHTVGETSVGPAPVASAVSTKGSSSPSSRTQIPRKEHTEEDGFVWYEIQKGNIYGAQDRNGNTVIPLTRGYSVVFYFDGAFYVYKNKKEGVCDLTGKEIISPSRGYDEVIHIETGYHVKRNGKEGFCDMTGKEIISPNRGYDECSYYSYDNYFVIKKNGKKGACDIYGKEVAAPIYNDVHASSSGGFRYQDDNGNWNPVPSPSSVASSASSSSTLSSSSSSITSSTANSNSTTGTSTTSATSSRYGSLLKGGTFTSTGVMNVMGTYTAVGNPYLTKFNVYTNYIVDEFGNAYPLNETLTFEGVSSRSYKCNDNLFYIYGDDQMLRKVEYESIFGVRTFTIYYYQYGDVRAAYVGGSATFSGSGGNTYGGSSSGGSTRQVQQRCEACHGTGICQSCNGRGMVINHYTGQYGSCTYCKNPYKGKCTSCSGTGRR